MTRPTPSHASQEASARHLSTLEAAYPLADAGRWTEVMAIAEAALAEAPRCPALIWLYAFSAHALGRHEQASAAYLFITEHGRRWLARSCCGRHRALATGLIADSFLHMSLLFRSTGDREASLRGLISHLDIRGPGCYSAYPLSTLPDDTRQLTVRRRWPNPGMQRTRYARR